MSETVSLIDLAGGAIGERLKLAMDEIIFNIDDPNTSETAAREITLKVKIKPMADRRNCTYSLTCVAKLAPVKEHLGLIVVGFKGDEAVVYENDPKQTELPLASPDNIKEINDVG